jgi:hypothetical protein
MRCSLPASSLLSNTSPLFIFPQDRYSIYIYRLCTIRQELIYTANDSLLKRTPSNKSPLTMENPSTTTTTTDEAFQYSPALLGPRLIRLIKLSPAWNKSAPLRISLKTVCVDNFTSYECLSYTWDGQMPDRLISCGRKLMPITANAEAAMRRFRRKHCPRWLWIDAICINQACIEEKNAQVSMMADIYRNARTVLVWLGAGTGDSEKAIAYCRRAVCIPLKHTRGLELPISLERSRWEGLMKQFYPRPNVKWMLEEGKVTKAFP